jgi:hypothetical protein
MRNCLIIERTIVSLLDHTQDLCLAFGPIEVRALAAGAFGTCHFECAFGTLTNQFLDLFIQTIDTPAYVL